MALTIPVLTKKPALIKELREALPNVIFHEVINPDEDDYFSQSEIIISDCDLLAPFMYNLSKTKWVQGTYAGVERLLAAVDHSKTIPFKFTRYSGEKCGLVMGEYVISNIISYERDFLKIRENQKKHLWERQDKMCDYRIIEDLTIGILGVGGIGTKIGQMLFELGAKILGYGRSNVLPRTKDFQHIHKYFPKENLREFLQQCDYLIAILPNTPETDGLLDGNILENCKNKKSILINIGRGNILSEKSIIKAIDEKWLSAAILDVHYMEPLPSTSKLWDLEQVIITPHVSGVNRPKHIAQYFKRNLKLYLENLPLPATIDLSKGY